MVGRIEQSGGDGRSVTRKLLFGMMSLALLATPLTAADGPGEGAKPGIDGLSARLDDNRALVSFHVSGAIGPETEELIHSGIPVLFRHKLEVLAKRNFPVLPLPARVLARTVVETRVEYDSLTRRYDLLRSIDHKSSKKKLKPPVEETKLVTDSLDEVRSWMTELEEIAVYDPSRMLRGERLRVHVEVSLGRRYVLLIFPGTLSTSAEIPLGP
jgi:hypothetical protein